MHHSRFIPAVIILNGLLLISFAGGAGAETTPSSDLIASIITGDEAQAAAALEKLKVYPASRIAEAIQGFDDYPRPAAQGCWMEAKHFISDTLTAPFWLYIPRSYNPRQGTPVIMWLHGGVSRPEFIEMDKEHQTDHPLRAICEVEGWLGVYPLGKIGLTWWDEAGMAHLQWIVRYIKRSFNIDNDRIAVCGFSDGASAGFHLAMTEPDDYSLFFPWSGHIAVGSLVTGQEAYLPNMANRFIFAANGGKDELYPTARMLPLLNLAQEAGAKLWFADYKDAPHSFVYSDAELPRFIRRVRDYARPEFQPRLVWETCDLAHNDVDWLEITGLDTLAPPSEWHRDYNLELEDSRLTIGFMHDRAYEGKGVKVQSLSEGDEVPAVKMGLAKDDIVIALGEYPVADIQSLSEAKNHFQRGDDFTLTVQRGEDTLTLKGTFPPVGKYKALSRNRRSGMVKAVYLGNRFEVETSRISSFALKLHPDMVQFDQPVVVVVNGQETFNQTVNEKPDYLLTNFMQNRDRARLWSARIEIKLK